MQNTEIAKLPARVATRQPEPIPVLRKGDEVQSAFKAWRSAISSVSYSSVTAIGHANRPLAASVPCAPSEVRTAGRQCPLLMPYNSLPPPAFLLCLRLRSSNIA